MRRNRYEILLAAIVLSGAVLRFVSLNSESIWLDEAFSADRARLSPSALMVDLRDNSVHPPLYFLVLKHWAAVFGFSEVGLRSFSAAAGVAGVIALYAFAKELHDRKVGIISAGVLAFSPFHIYYSQEARSYTLLFLFAVLSMHAYWLAFVSRRTGATTAYYVLVTLLLLYLHFYALFVPIAQAIHFGIFRARSAHRSEIKGFGGASLMILVLSTPLAVITFHQLGTATQNFTGPAPRLLSLARHFTIFGGDRLSATSQYVRFPVGIALISTLAAVALVPGFKHHQGKRAVITKPESHWQRAGLLAIWIGSSVLLPFYLSKLTTPILSSRVLIPALAPMLVLASVGLARIRPPSLSVAILLVALSLAISPLKAQYEIKSKAEWRDAAAYVEQRASRGAALVFHASFAYRPFTFYQTRPDLDIVPADADAVSLDNMERRLEGKEEVWLFAYHEKQLDRIIARLEGNYRFLGRPMAFLGIRLFRLEPLDH